MEVIVAKTAGFCFGVKRAVEKVYANVDKEHVYTYGPIIHNEQVVADLEKHGVKVVEEDTDLTQLSEGTIVVRAHGASRAEFYRLRECGMQIEDATMYQMPKSSSGISITSAFTSKGSWSGISS